MRRSNRRRHRKTSLAAAISSGAAEVLEVRQLLSSVTVAKDVSTNATALDRISTPSTYVVETKSAPTAITQISVIRESTHSPDVTIAWYDGLPTLDLLQGYDYMTEYEVRLKNESLITSPAIYAQLASTTTTRFDPFHALNNETLLRPMNSGTRLEVEPGNLQRFSAAKDYTLTDGVYTFTIRQRIISAFTLDVQPSQTSPANALTTEWSEWSDPTEFVVAPEGESFVLTAPESIQKHTLSGPSIFSAIPEISWGHIHDAESIELWISRDGVGRVYYNPAMIEQSLQIDDSFEIGRHKFWVRANYADGSKSQWSSAETFEITHRFLVSSLSSQTRPNDPFTFSFAHEGASTGDVEITIYKESSASDQPYLHVTVPGTENWVYEQGFPEGNYRFEIRQILPNGDIGPIRIDSFVVSSRVRPGFRSKTAGATVQGAWARHPAHTSYELWIAYDGPTNGLPADGQQPDHRYIVEKQNAYPGTQLYTLPADAPAGEYRAWVRGFTTTADGTEVPDPWSETEEFSIFYPRMNVWVNNAFFDDTPTISWSENPFAESFVVTVYESEQEPAQNQSSSIVSQASGRGRKILQTIVRDVSSFTLPDRLKAGHFIASVTAVYPTGEIESDEASFAHRAPLISTVPWEGARRSSVISTNQIPGAAEYEFWVSYLGDNGKGTDFDYFVQTTSSPWLSLPDDAPAGDYKTWLRARSNAVGESSWSDWSEPAEFQVLAETSITTVGGTYHKFPMIEWTSSASTFQVVVRDRASNEIVASEVVRDATSWQFSDAVDGTSYLVSVTAYSDQGVPGTYSSTVVTTLRIPHLSISTYLGHRLYWTSYRDIERYDLWVAQDSILTDEGSAEAPNFRFVVKSNIESTGYGFSREIAPGSYRAWIRIADSGNGPGEWTPAFQFEIPAVATSPGISIIPREPTETPRIVNAIGIYVLPTIKVAELVAEQLPTPAAPQIEGIVPASGDPDGWILRWKDGSLVTEQGRFRTADGLTIATRLINRIQVSIVNTVTGEKLSPDGLTRTDTFQGTTVIQDSQVSGPIYTSFQELSRQLNLKDGRYEIRMRFRNLQTFENVGPGTSAGLSSRLGFPSAANRYPGSQVSAISSEWSDWSVPLNVQIGDGTDAPQVSATQSIDPTLQWSQVAGANRYEVAVQNLHTGEHFRRVLPARELDTTTISLRHGYYRAWVRAIQVDGTLSLWSTSTNFIA